MQEQSISPKFQWQGVVHGVRICPGGDPADHEFVLKIDIKTHDGTSDTIERKVRQYGALLGMLNNVALENPVVITLGYGDATVCPVAKASDGSDVIGRRVSPVYGNDARGNKVTALPKPVPVQFGRGTVYDSNDCDQVIVNTLRQVQGKLQAIKEDQAHAASLIEQTHAASQIEQVQEDFVAAVRQNGILHVLENIERWFGAAARAKLSDYLADTSAAEAGAWAALETLRRAQSLPNSSSAGARLLAAAELEQLARMAGMAPVRNILRQAHDAARNQREQADLHPVEEHVGVPRSRG